MNWEQLDAAIKSAHLKAVVRHWFEARGDAVMPKWADLRPARMAQNLPYVWIYGFDRDLDAFVGRLAGSRIEAVFDRGFRGSSMAELYPDSDFQRLFHCAKRVLDRTEAYRGEGRIHAHGYHFVFGERLILPLAEDETFAGSILGCSDVRAIDVPQEPDVPHHDQWFSLGPA